MIAAIKAFPLLIVMVLTFCMAMTAPALHAIWLGDWAVARAFLFYAAFFAVIAGMIGLARSAAPRRGAGRPERQLLSLLLAYVLLPLVLAAPVVRIMPSVTYSQAYFEMLSALTTTGATVFSDPSILPDPLNLWRGMVAWMGGFLTLVAAMAILEPMRLGGFEIEAGVSPGQGQDRRSAGGGAGGAGDRLRHNATLVLPAYVGLTTLLALGLMIAGDRALVAAIHAMSVLSTSGITPLREFSTAASAHMGEIMIFIFLLAAINRRWRVLPRSADLRWNKLFDQEYQLALGALGTITAVLFIRHFLAAYEVAGQDNAVAALRAIWGTLFSALSFLSTTGFFSSDWAAVQNWSGLSTPGIILLALCMMGGGIATTTGGIKLLRLYALYKHGIREMQRLIHPSSVGGAGITARRIRREGAQIAWVFLMLFLIGVSCILMALTALGQGFEAGLSLAIASMTNTGPAAMLLDPNVDYALLGAPARAVLCGAMIFGRLEVLVLVSMFNPAYWRQ